MTADLSKFYKIDLDARINLVSIIWLESSADMSDEEFITIQNIFLGELVSNKAQKTIIDLRKMEFVVRPSIQEKIARENYPKAIAAGLRKVAIVNSPELISQLSAEQMMDEDESGIFTTRYFDNLKDARNWVEQ